MSLHIRQKKNSSGSISIQIIDRVDRRYKVIETIDCLKSEVDIEIYLDVKNYKIRYYNLIVIKNYYSSICKKIKKYYL